jgi:hypothetical protein
MTLAWRGAVVGVVAVLMLIFAANVVLPQPRPGVEPQDAWTCPLSHPIEGDFTTYSGERCVYHVSGGEGLRQDQAGAVLRHGGGSLSRWLPTVEAVMVDGARVLREP